MDARCTSRSRAIPTRVGSSLRSLVNSASEPGHPHACGEQRVARRPGALGFGPSPRVWGAASPPGAGHDHARAIPTRVGSSSQVSIERF